MNLLSIYQQQHLKGLDTQSFSFESTFSSNQFWSDVKEKKRRKNGKFFQLFVRFKGENGLCSHHSTVMQLYTNSVQYILSKFPGLPFQDTMCRHWEKDCLFRPSTEPVVVSILKISVQKKVVETLENFEKLCFYLCNKPLIQSMNAITFEICFFKTQ